MIFRQKLGLSRAMSAFRTARLLAAQSGARSNNHSLRAIRASSSAVVDRSHHLGSHPPETPSRISSGELLHLDLTASPRSDGQPSTPKSDNPG